MGAPKITKVTIDSKDSLDVTISQYAAQGFTMVNKSDRGATLQKPKKFNVAIGIITFLFCIIGLVIYAIIYSSQPDVEIVEITVSGPPPLS